MGHMLANDDGLEEDYHPSVNALELEMFFKKIRYRHPLILDIKRLEDNQRCYQDACPCGSMDYIRFLSFCKDLLRQSFDSAEYSASNSVSHFCRRTSLLNNPVNLCSTEFFINYLRHHIRARSTTSLGDFTVDYASEAESGNIIISTSGQWMSMERILKTNTLLKDLFFQLASIDSAMSQVIARNFNTRQIKFSANSPSRLCNNSSQEQECKLISTDNQRSEWKDSGKTVVSCSSSSSYSYQSPSSAHSPVSKGFLHCQWKRGAPYFVFAMDIDCCEVYVASPCKIGSSVDKSLDYMYLFHSRAGNQKELRNCSNTVSGFVGKMKVSSSIVLESNRSKVMETEFVLFGADKDNHSEMHSPASTHMKSKGLTRKVTDIFRPTNSFMHKSNCKVSEPSFRIQDFLQGPFLSESNNYGKSGLVNHLENDFPPNLELAAIVVKDYQHYNNAEVKVGGWGLKLLEKITTNQFGTPLDPSLFSRSGERSQEGSKVPAKSMNVLLPSGFHGVTATGTGGPSSLTQRWRSGGHCDCGGWDIGCPLTVLNNNSIVSEALPQESQEDCKSINLFIEGKKHGEPILKMVSVKEGVYSMCFQSTLSALQSFSIGVAIIHTQTPTLCPKL